jgi:hypothetical protein
MVDWFAPDFGGHVHADSTGSFVPDSHSETAEDY